MKKTCFGSLLTATLLLICLIAAPAFAGQDPLARWKPDFDPSTARYTYLLSCVGHPAIEGVAVGFRIRDRVWEETDGQLYVDFRPLSQLGGEKDVINKLKMGAPGHDELFGRRRQHCPDPRHCQPAVCHRHLRQA